MGRPRKKTAAKERAPAVPKMDLGVVGPEQRDDGIYMSRMDFFQADAVHAKAIVALQAQGLVKLRLEGLERDKAAAIVDFDNKINSARAEIAMVSAERSRREAETKAFWNAMSEVYKVDFNVTPYDDVTGRINVIEDVPGRGDEE